MRKISLNTRIQNPTGYKENKKERNERNMSWTRNMRREAIPQIAENGFDNANKHLHPQSKFKRAWLRLHSAGALLIYDHFGESVCIGDPSLEEEGASLGYSTQGDLKQEERRNKKEERKREEEIRRRRIMKHEESRTRSMRRDATPNCAAPLQKLLGHRPSPFPP